MDCNIFNTLVLIVLFTAVSYIYLYIFSWMYETAKEMWSNTLKALERFVSSDRSRKLLKELLVSVVAEGIAVGIEEYHRRKGKERKE